MCFEMVRGTREGLRRHQIIGIKKKDPIKPIVSRITKPFVAPLRAAKFPIGIIKEKQPNFLERPFAISHGLFH